MVGVNKFTETEPNPLTADLAGSILTVDIGSSRPPSTR